MILWEGKVRIINRKVNEENIGRGYTQINAEVKGERRKGKMKNGKNDW